MHFANKEEIVVALVIRPPSERVDLFQRAAGFPGKTRERMLAMVLPPSFLPRFFQSTCGWNRSFASTPSRVRPSAERQ